MTRKTRVRIVGDPEMCIAAIGVLKRDFETSEFRTFGHAAGRMQDSEHSKTPAATVYITILKKKERAPTL